MWNDPSQVVLQQDCHSLPRQHVASSSDHPILILPRLSEQRGRDSMKFEARIAHNFSLKTYGMPTFCELCGSMLWGITKQGYQCTSPNCFLNVHNECREVRKRQFFTISLECRQPALWCGQNEVCRGDVGFAKEGGAENQKPHLAEGKGKERPNY